MRISNRIGSLRLRAATNLAIYAENMEYWWALGWTNYLACPESPHKVQSVAVRLAFGIHKMQTISNFDEFLPLSSEHEMSAIVVKNRQMWIIGRMPKNVSTLGHCLLAKKSPKSWLLLVAWSTRRMLNIGFYSHWHINPCFSPDLCSPLSGAEKNVNIKQSSTEMASGRKI